MRGAIIASGLALMAALSSLIFAAVFVVPLPAQNSPDERAFPQSKAAVEKAVAALRENLAGRLPVLDGFAQVREHPLDRYRRAYYQSTVEVSSTPSGGSRVRVSTKVTAWYADPVASRSGYQLLPSNGRIEADLLEQLAEQLAESSAEGSGASVAISSQKPSTEVPVAEPKISGPAPKFSDSYRTFSSSLSKGLSRDIAAPEDPATAQNAVKSDRALQAEVDSMEEILKNQVHPPNLVAVKKWGTPVVSAPSLAAKQQFLASMHDEFELLDFNANWVHVRISGLSRGWIWRNSVEMPDGIRDSDTPATSVLTAPGELFHVVREESSTFPGDWEQLRNKDVKIISVQKTDENANAGPSERLEYTKFLLDRNYKELAQNPSAPAGVVVIFDSADGGMMAATMVTLRQWRAGTLSDSALWHKCFFDPPESFQPSGSSTSQ